MKVSIIIGTHGTDAWKDLAWSRAFPSAISQGAHEVLIDHEPDATRAEVRNRLVEQATGDWICTLDADDELAPGYVDAMTAAWRNSWYPAPDVLEFASSKPPLLFTPAIQYVRNGKPQPPMFWPEVNLHDANWLIVGTLIPLDLFLEVGGWKHLDSTGTMNEWDDWHLFSRCVRAGARIVKVPDAVYIAHVRARSPHYSANGRTRQAWLKEIRDDVWGEVTA